MAQEGAGRAATARPGGAGSAGTLAALPREHHARPGTAPRRVASILEELERTADRVERARLKVPPPLAEVLAAIGRELADASALVEGLADVDPDDVEEEAARIERGLLQVRAGVLEAWTACRDLGLWRPDALLGTAGDGLREAADRVDDAVSEMIADDLFGDELSEAAE